MSCVCVCVFVLLSHEEETYMMYVEVSSIIHDIVVNTIPEKTHSRGQASRIAA